MDIMVGNNELLYDQLEQAAHDSIAELERCELEMEQLAAPYERSLRELTAQRDAAIAGAKYSADLARESAKRAVLALGSTVDGTTVMAVYVGGRVSWNTDALDALSDVYPEIARHKNLGQPSITFRHHEVKEQL